MDLPWGTDNELKDSQFFNRINDFNLLYSMLDTTGRGSAPSILLTGIRGVGKTALMKKLQRKFENDYLVIYVDLSKSDAFQENNFTRKSFMDLFYRRIIQACGKQNLITVDKRIQKLLKTNKWDMDKFIDWGDMSIPHISSHTDYPSLAEFVMNLPQQIYNEHSSKMKGIIVFFDEFQNIKELKEDLNSFLWFLRSYMQDQKNVAYVLSGSMSLKDDLIEDIAGKKGAFGGRMLTVEIQPFSYKTTKKYLNEKAELLDFTDDGIERFYKCTKGLPSYINNFANLLPQNKKLDEKEVITQFKKDLPLLNVHNINLWYKLTLQEQKIIVSLIKKPLIRKELSKKLGVTTGSISKPLNKLKNLMIIEQDNKEYKIYDEIFKLWLKNYKKENDCYPFRVT